MTFANASGNKLSDEALLLLLSEFADLVASKRSLSAGLRHYEDISLGSIGEAAKSIRLQLEDGKDLSEAFDQITSKYDNAIKSTLKVVMDTGSWEPLYLLVDLIRQKSAERKQRRLSAVPPLLNTFLAAGILFLVLPYIIHSVASYNLSLIDQYPMIFGVADWLANQPFVAGFIALVVSIFLGCLFFIVGRRLNQKGRVFGEYSIFACWLASQIQPRGSSPNGRQDEAEIRKPVLSSMIMCSADAACIADEWCNVPKKLQQGAVNINELAIPVSCPDPIGQCVVDLASGKRNQDLVAGDLRTISEIYQQRAHHHGRWSRQMAPQILAWVLMISMMILLIQVILYPLLEVLKGTLP